MERPSVTPQSPEKQASPFPSKEETASLIAAGYTVDSLGRPLHPLKESLGPNTPESKGGFWNWGPNYTADPIVITTEDRPSILLITRADTRALALPGGFIDPEEFNMPMAAALRELREETGLVITTEGKLVYQGVVDDPRASLHAWPETSAYLFTLPKRASVEVVDEHEAPAVNWYYIDELPDTLHGSHAQLIRRALGSTTILPRRTIDEILRIPTEERTVEYIDAGHMAYDHLFTRHGDDHLFVKLHDSSRFTDPFREAHSRAYLKKEYELYNHLKEEGFTSLPNRVALIDDTILGMDALHPQDGWMWRAPSREPLTDTYVRDTLEAFQTLQATTPPPRPNYHESIDKTYETTWSEGWDAINKNRLDRIVDRIRSFSIDWTAEQQAMSEALINDLPLLQQGALALDRDEPLFMAHNDARQSNIAWHPQQGTRIVDWSWGDLAPKNADATMFLIDLAKSRHDITPYLESYNTNYALTLIGFWLAHSIWETHDGSSTVREHQVASAVTAYKLCR